MSDTTRILSLISKPEVELVKGKVMPRVGWEWLLGFGVTYFSLMSKAGEILVTLPKMLWQDFQAGTEVWVLGNVSGERMSAEMIFFPHSQKYIQLIQTRKPPIWTALILALTGLVLLTQDVMWVLYYLGIPALLLPMFVSMATSIPRRCSYEGWQLVEHDLGMYTFEFPLVTGRVSYYQGVRGMLCAVGWAQAYLAITTSSFSLGVTSVFSMIVNLLFLNLVVATATYLTLSALRREEW